MHILNPSLRRLGLSVGALLLVSACAGSSSAGWTYAPLGPTAAPSSSAAPSTGPTASPSLVLDVVTNNDRPLVFVPNELEAPPATVVQVNYNNNSSLQHNINFFDGPDNTAPSLGATKIVIGPNAIESVTFTTPAEAGDYYFWCDVHFAGMSGTLHVR